jgi:Protein of unknown function (DUF2971)
VYQVSKEVQEFFHCRIPKEVWHYTSLKGFQGILSSGKIWATEARFTMDKSEYIFAKNVAADYLRSTCPPDEFSREVVDGLLKTIKASYKVGILSPKFADVFVASFSAARDLKSQWSEYGDAYRGVSIGFDLGPVRPPLETDTSVTVAPCIYKASDQTRLVGASIRRFMEHVDALREDYDENAAIDRSWPIIQGIFGESAGKPPYRIRTAAQIFELLKQGVNEMNRDLFVLTSHCKNPRFEEENEWRVVMPRSRKKDSADYPIKYRDKEWDEKIVQAPYIEIKLDAEREKLPITRVMAGPKCDHNTIRSILDKYDYEVPLIGSEIPVR